MELKGNVKWSAAIMDVLSERTRQQAQEGENFSATRDDTYVGGELALAAASYAMFAHFGEITALALWPENWDRSWLKHTTERRDLVKAAALIIADIERLDRAAERNKT